MASLSSRTACWAMLLASIHSFVQAQDQTQISSNGLVLATGDPNPSRSVSYTFVGGTDPVLAPTALATITAGDASPFSTGTSSPKYTGDHGLSVPAILGIVLGIVALSIAIIATTIFVWTKKRRASGQAKRKSIMDAEFAVSATQLSPPEMQTRSTPRISKPLPVLTELPEFESLSRSSTIIADAAGDVAQINRKASTYQAEHKHQREKTRERNHALQILVTNNSKDRDDATLASPLTSNPTTPVSPPVSPISGFHKDCPDNNGDAFAQRVSKL